MRISKHFKRLKQFNIKLKPVYIINKTLRSRLKYPLKIQIIRDVRQNSSGTNYGAFEILLKCWINSERQEHRC